VRVLVFLETYKHYKDDLIKILDLHVKDNTRRMGSYLGRHH